MRARQQPHHSDYHVKPCIICDRPRVSLERSPEGTHFLVCLRACLQPVHLARPGSGTSTPSVLTPSLVSCLV